MKMKKINAKDMKEALKIVRDTLGKDAMILTTRKTADGVEVMAALDNSKNFTETVLNTSSENHIRKSMTVTDPALDALREELYILRQVVQEELGHFAYQDVAHKHPIQAMIYEKMLQIELVKPLSKTIAGTIKDQNSLKNALIEASNTVYYALKDRVYVAKENTKAYVFSGLNGSGKTSSMAAFALQYRLQHPKSQIRFINLDHEKAAAHEPLQTLAKILNAEYTICESDKELKKWIQQEDVLTLIDLSLEKAVEYKDCLLTPGVMGAFVMAAPTQYAAYERLKPLFAAKLFKLAVITHIDEAGTFGAATSLLIQENLAPWFSVNAQKQSQGKKLSFFDAKNWTEQLFENLFQAMKETKLKGVA